jgi:hypothetical protein
MSSAAPKPNRPRVGSIYDTFIMPTVYENDPTN